MAYEFAGPDRSGGSLAGGTSNLPTTSMQLNGAAMRSGFNYLPGADQEFCSSKMDLIQDELMVNL